MTKKHFIALADHIKNTRFARTSNTGIFSHPGVIDSLADFCQSQNPRFNRDRWVMYINGECGKNGGKVKK